MRRHVGQDEHELPWHLREFVPSCRVLLVLLVLPLLPWLACLERVDRVRRVGLGAHPLWAAA